MDLGDLDEDHYDPFEASQDDPTEIELDAGTNMPGFRRAGQLGLQESSNSPLQPPTPAQAIRGPSSGGQASSAKSGDSTIARILTPGEESPVVAIEHRFSIERPEQVSAQTMLRRRMRIPLPPSESIEHTMMSLFGKNEFRGAQREAMTAALEGYDVFVVAPTGMGKSLCFQVPAMAKSFGATLVISPLLSLIDNQVEALTKLQGIRAVSVTSKISREQRKKVRCADWSSLSPQVKKGMLSGHPQDRLVYLTPEMLLSNDLKPTLDRMHAQNELARLVVDEAHIIAEWGREFRPNYARLGEFRERYPSVPIMALTASATSATADFIVESLQMDPEALVKVKHSVNRPNIYLEVRPVSDRRIERCREIADIIDELAHRRGKDGKVDETSARAIAGIVYCRQRDECDEVAAFLKRHGINAAAYHSGIKDRDMIARQWERNDLNALEGKPRVDCVVATVAFGLGYVNAIPRSDAVSIDKPNCRYVIHFNLPKSFEGLYQEAGRAGRDGHACHHIAFYSREDNMRISSLVDYDLARSKGTVNLALASEARKSLRAVITYMERPDLCRHVAVCALRPIALLTHAGQFFGEQITQDEAKTVCDKMCDVCKSPELVKRRMQDALSAPAAVESRFVELAFEATQQVRRDDGEDSEDSEGAVEVFVKPAKPAPKFARPNMPRAPEPRPSTSRAWLDPIGPALPRPPPMPQFAAPKITAARAQLTSMPPATPLQIVEEWADRVFPTSSAAMSAKKPQKFKAPAIRSGSSSKRSRQSQSEPDEYDAPATRPKRQRLATDFMLSEKPRDRRLEDLEQYKAPKTTSRSIDAVKKLGPAGSDFASPFRAGKEPTQHHLKERYDPPSSPHPAPPTSFSLATAKHNKPISNEARQEAIIALDKRLCHAVLKMPRARSDGSRRKRGEELAICALLGVTEIEVDKKRDMLLDAATYLENIVLFSSTSMRGYRDILGQRLDALDQMISGTEWFDKGVLAAPNDAAIQGIIDALQSAAGKVLRGGIKKSKRK